MTRTARIAAASAVVVTALLMSVAPMQRAGAAPSHRTPVVLEQARSAGGYWSDVAAVRRPHLFRIMMGGPNLYVRSVRWTAWHDTYARGSGELIGQDMGTYRLGHVTLKLNHVVTSHGHTYFGYLHIVGGRNVVHYWKWNWFPRNNRMWLQR